MPDNVDTKTASNVPVASDVVTYSGDAGQNVQLIRPVGVTGSEGSKTVVDIPTDGTYGLGVEVKRGVGVSYFVTVTGSVTLPTGSTYTATNAMSDSATSPITGGNTLTDCARVSGGSGIITDIVFTASVSPATLLQAELWLFNQAVTNINNNAAFALSDAEILTCVGKVAFSMESAGANNSIYHAQGLNLGFTCVGTANLRYLLRAKNAYVWASSEVIGIMAKIIQTN